MREPEPLFSLLKAALIGLEPLPWIIVPNEEADQPDVQYFRRANGDWTWKHPANSGRGLTCLARAGTRKALELDSLLLTGNPEGNA